MNTTQKTQYIDYWTIFNELSKGICSEDDDQVKRCNLTRKQMVEEYRTIGLKSSRQTGKTDFIVSFLKEKDDAIVIVTNLNFKNDIINRCKRIGLDDISNRVLTTRDIWLMADDVGMCQFDLFDVEKVTTVVVDESFHVYARFSRSHILDFFSNVKNLILLEIN